MAIKNPVEGAIENFFSQLAKPIADAYVWSYRILGEGLMMTMVIVGGFFIGKGIVENLHSGYEEIKEEMERWQ